ncbi:lipoprotein NlpI [Planctomycetes bacterium MalM25]|nr:lipoprotein NlpI [Planctomycetes bacterium MalM25]
MRTSFTATLFIALACHASIGMGQEGVIYVDDMPSVDRAVLEAADLTLPPMQGAVPRMSPQAMKPMAYAPAGGGVKPVAYSGGVRPSTQSGPAEQAKRPGLFGGIKKPSWLFGKKQEKPAPSDPFANATRQAKLNTVQAAQRVQPIPSHVGGSQRGVATAGYQKQPMAKKRSSQLNGGLNLRSTAGPRRGLLSGLWGDSPSKPAAKSPANTMPKPQGFASSQGPSAGKIRNTKLRPGGAKSTAKPSSPRPMAQLASRPMPPQAKPVRKAIPESLVKQQPSEVTNRFAIESEPETMEPAGEFIMVSDDSVAEPKLSAPLVQAEEVEPAKTVVLAPAASLDAAPQSTEEAKPMVVLGVPAVEKSPEVEVLAPPTPQAPEPVVVENKPQPMPIEPAPMAEPVAPRMTTINRYTTTQAAPLTAPEPVTPAEPSERSKALLAEAHELAATAAAYDDFSAVVKRCRYVLAIDASPVAQSYANQLSGWALTKRGDTLDALGRFVEARTDYHEALRCDAECWRAEHALGVLAAREGDAATALGHFNRTIELNPEYAKAFSNRAALSVQAGDYQTALVDYQQAIEIDPDLAVAHIGRGRVCHMLGLLDEGLRHLDAAEVLSPADAMIATGRGDLLTDLGRYGQAFQAYQRAIEIDPTSAAAHRNLAWMQATCPVDAFRDGESALQHAEAAARLAPGADDLTLDTQAAALAAVGRFDEATEMQRRAIELAPESDTGVYRERLAMYERGEAFTSKPVAVQQASYLR